MKSFTEVAALFATLVIIVQCTKLQQCILDVSLLDLQGPSYGLDELCVAAGHKVTIVIRCISGLRYASQASLDPCVPHRPPLVSLPYDTVGEPRDVSLLLWLNVGHDVIESAEHTFHPPKDVFSPQRVFGDVTGTRFDLAIARKCRNSHPHGYQRMEAKFLIKRHQEDSKQHITRRISSDLIASIVRFAARRLRRGTPSAEESGEVISTPAHRVKNAVTSGPAVEDAGVTVSLQEQRALFDGKHSTKGSTTDEKGENDLDSVVLASSKDGELRKWEEVWLEDGAGRVEDVADWSEKERYDSNDDAGRRARTFTPLEPVVPAPVAQLNVVTPILTATTVPYTSTTVTSLDFQDGYDPQENSELRKSASVKDTDIEGPGVERTGAGSVSEPVLSTKDPPSLSLSVPPFLAVNAVAGVGSVSEPVLSTKDPSSLSLSGTSSPRDNVNGTESGELVIAVNNMTEKNSVGASSAIISSSSSSYSEDTTRSTPETGTTPVALATVTQQPESVVTVDGRDVTDDSNDAIGTDVKNTSSSVGIDTTTSIPVTASINQPATFEPVSISTTSIPVTASVNQPATSVPVPVSSAVPVSTTDDTTNVFLKPSVPSGSIELKTIEFINETPTTAALVDTTIAAIKTAISAPVGTNITAIDTATMSSIVDTEINAAMTGTITAPIETKITAVRTATTSVDSMSSARKTATMPNPAYIEDVTKAAVTLNDVHNSTGDVSSSLLATNTEGMSSNTTSSSTTGNDKHRTTNRARNADQQATLLSYLNSTVTSKTTTTSTPTTRGAVTSVTGSVTAARTSDTNTEVIGVFTADNEVNAQIASTGQVDNARETSVTWTVTDKMTTSPPGTTSPIQSPGAGKAATKVTNTTATATVFALNNTASTMAPETNTNISISTEITSVNVAPSTQTSPFVNRTTSTDSPAVNMTTSTDGSSVIMTESKEVPSVNRTSPETSSVNWIFTGVPSVDRVSTETSSLPRASTDASSVNKTSTDVLSINRTSTETSSVDRSSTDVSTVNLTTGAPSVDRTSLETPFVTKTSAETSSVNKTSTEVPSVKRTSTETLSANTPADTTYVNTSTENSSVNTSTETPSVDWTYTEASSVEWTATETTSVDMTYTEAPSVELTATKTPSVYRISTETPSIDSTSTEAPSVDRRSTETPSIYSTSTEAPSVDRRSTETPSIDSTSTEAPSVDRASTDTPYVETTCTEAPSVSMTPQSGERSAVATTSQTDAGSNTSAQVLSQDADGGDDTAEEWNSLWPVVASLVIGIPSVIVFIIALVVVHRKKIASPSRLRITSTPPSL